MAKKLELYRCNICGNLIEVILEGAGEIVCCGEHMELLEEKNNTSESGEKHVPVISDYNETFKKITVNNHPMQKEHYITFIQAYSKEKNEICLKYLHPEEKAEFTVPSSINLKSREFCNIHGLWGEKFSE